MNISHAMRLLRLVSIRLISIRPYGTTQSKRLLNLKIAMTKNAPIRILTFIFIHSKNQQMLNYFSNDDFLLAKMEKIVYNI